MTPRNVARRSALSTTFKSNVSPQGTATRSTSRSHDSATSAKRSEKPPLTRERIAPSRHVADRHLHEAGRRRGADVHRPRGEQHVAQARLRCARTSPRNRVRDGPSWARELRENLAADFGRARNEERPELRARVIDQSYAWLLHEHADAIGGVSTRPAVRAGVSAASSIVERRRSRARTACRSRAASAARTSSGRRRCTSSNTIDVGERARRDYAAVLEAEDVRGLRAAPLHRALERRARASGSRTRGRASGTCRTCADGRSLPSESGDDEVLLHEVLDVLLVHVERGDAGIADQDDRERRLDRRCLARCGDRVETFAEQARVARRGDEQRMRSAAPPQIASMSLTSRARVAGSLTRARSESRPPASAQRGRSDAPRLVPDAVYGYWPAVTSMPAARAFLMSAITCRSGPRRPCRAP